MPLLTYLRSQKRCWWRLDALMMLFAMLPVSYTLIMPWLNWLVNKWNIRRKIVVLGCPNLSCHKSSLALISVNIHSMRIAFRVSSPSSHAHLFLIYQWNGLTLSRGFMTILYRPSSPALAMAKILRPCQSFRTSSSFSTAVEMWIFLALKSM